MEENIGNAVETDFFSKTMPVAEVKAMNPLTLAYIGDAVYEIAIRKYLVLNHRAKVNALNKMCIQFVKATAQKNALCHLKEELTEEEVHIVKRGRNASPKTSPKNTPLSDYKLATGFEALIGYLYLIGDKERLEYLIVKAIKSQQNDVKG